MPALSAIASFLGTSAGAATVAAAGSALSFYSARKARKSGERQAAAQLQAQKEANTLVQRRNEEIAAQKNRELNRLKGGSNVVLGSSRRGGQTAIADQQRRRTVNNTAQSNSYLGKLLPGIVNAA